MSEIKNLLSPDSSLLREPSRTLQYERSLQLGTYRDPKHREDLLGILNTVKAGQRDVSSKTMSSKRTYFGCNHGAPRILISFLEDWAFLALLGIIMACCSLMMDIAIDKLQLIHIWLFDAVKQLNYIVLSYAVWVAFVVVLICCSALFVHYVAPQAIGSGIPEMKTILRGVILKEYLSIRTLISKMVGLTLSLGSGIPMGKEGPFVHVASVVANLLSNLKHGKSNVFENEVNNSEMLAAGCAVGVACTFSAPVGGVLFSIEVTSVYFAVRNYWRGFFAAIVSASLFRMFMLLHKSAQDVVSVQAHFQTRFPVTDAFLPTELPVFFLLGIACGLFGAAFIYLNRCFVLFLRRSKVVKKIFMQYWLVYPIVVSFVISSVTFPLGAGGYLGGEQKFVETLGDLFTDCVLHLGQNQSRPCTLEMQEHWSGPVGETSIFKILPIFFFTFYFLSLLSSTLPVPSGVFMPVFVLGAAMGRFTGEGMSLFYPLGMDPSRVDANGAIFPIRPGAYAVVGAAAMCGAVTHTVSIVVIVMELTGQLALLLPVMIAVLTANAVCACFQPSIYDSIIKMKHLPYLPDISHSTSIFHKIRADQVMMTPVRFVAKDSTYGELQETLFSMPDLRAFPLVDSKNRMTLLGSISRSQLVKLVENNVGIKARQAEARRRIQAAVNKVDESLQLAPTTVADLFAAGPIRDNEGKKEETKGKEKKKFMVSKVNRQQSEPFKNEVEALKDAALQMGVKRHVLQELEDLQKREETEESNYHTIGGMFRSLTRKSLGKHKKPPKNEFDLHDEDRIEWERKMLNEAVDLYNCNVDSSPFQIVEQTSLFKVHSLFSLLGLHRAYVSSSGRLVGVISLKELRAALELIFSGKFPAVGESMIMDYAPEEEEHDFILPKLEVLTRSSTETLLSENKEGDPEIRQVEQQNNSSNLLGVTAILISSTSDPCLHFNTNDKTGLIDGESPTADQEEEQNPLRKKKKRKPSVHVRITEPDD